MALRDFLLGAQQLQEGSDQYARGAEEIRKQAALRDLQTASPQIFEQLKSSDPNIQSQAAARYNELSIRAGQPDRFSDQIAKFAFQNNKGAGQPLTHDQIKNLYPDAPEEAINSAVNITDLKAQQKALGDLGVSKRSARNYGLSSEKTSVGQGSTAYTKLDKTEDAFRDQDYKLKEIQQALKSNSSLGDNIAFGYIARSVAQEKGPLSDSDLSRIQGIVGYRGQLDKFKSYLTGDIYETLSPQQKGEIEKIIANSANNFKAKKSEALAADLNGLYQSQTRLRDAKGNPTGILKQRLDQYKNEGTPISFDEEKKSFVVTKGKSTASGAVSEMINAANSIKNPDLRNKYLMYLNSNSEKDFTDAEKNHILSQIKAASQ